MLASAPTELGAILQLLLQPAHHLAELGTDLLDGMVGGDAARGGVCGVWRRASDARLLPRVECRAGQRFVGTCRFWGAWMRLGAEHRMRGRDVAVGTP